MTLYLSQLLCFALMPLLLITDQGLSIPILGVLVLLIRRQAIQQQQIDYLLGQDDVNQLRNLAQRPTGVKPLERVKGL